MQTLAVENSSSVPVVGGFGFGLLLVLFWFLNCFTSLSFNHSYHFSTPLVKYNTEQQNFFSFLGDSFSQFTQHFRKSSILATYLCGKFLTV